MSHFQQIDSYHEPDEKSGTLILSSYYILDNGLVILESKEQTGGSNLSVQRNMNLLNIP
jgi:hypothetical protein